MPKGRKKVKNGSETKANAVKIKVLSNYPSIPNSDEIIEIKQFLTQPAKVGFGAGYTFSGNFQSFRVYVYAEVPCYLEEIEKAYLYAKDTVINKLLELRKEIKGTNGDYEE
ncbi:MAG: hypothetical protein QW228_03210 [Candidatus Aenigmatarchaeota archaeon]